MEWISVKERLPENDEDVICWVCEFGLLPNDGYMKRLYYCESRWMECYDMAIWDFADNPDCMQVTHWCEIEKPKN